MSAENTKVVIHTPDEVTNQIPKTTSLTFIPLDTLTGFRETILPPPLQWIDTSQKDITPLRSAPQ